MKCFVCVLILLNGLMSWSQLVTGTVFDLRTGEPLLGASVYLDGTSTGTITNEQGYFSIRPAANSNANLVIAFIGYTTQSMDSSDFREGLEIGMEEAVFSIPEVVLVADPFTREQKLTVFRLEFLGSSKAAETCTIANEDDLELYFDTKDNTLNAYAQTPIIIANNYLGYKVQFALKDFKIQFRERSVDRTDNLKFTIIHGSSFFEDAAMGKEYYVQRRAEVYAGSVHHFIKTLWHQNWQDEKFELRKNGRTVHPSKVFTVSAGKSLSGKNVRFLADRVVIKFKKGIFNYRSTLQVTGGNTFVIDAFGNYRPFDGLLFGGHMAANRIAELLPSDYRQTGSLD